MSKTPESDKADNLAEAERRIRVALKEKSTTLDLSALGLESLPESLGHLIHLQELALINNKLTTLPEWLGLLTDLQVLFLISNQFTTLPEWLGQLTGLQTLDLGNNRLVTFAGMAGAVNRLA